MSNSPIPRDNPLDALWSAKAIVWILAAGLGVSIVLALAGPGDGGRLLLFGRICVMVQWVLLTTLAMMYGLSGQLARRSPQMVAYVALCLLLANTWAVTTIAWLIFKPLSLSATANFESFAARALGIAFAVGLLGLAAFHNHWRARMLAVRAKQAELEALQARIRPHFLFNTLNTGAALVHLRPEEAERLLVDLADLFRAALAGPREIQLADELALARRYLEIESLRFGDRLEVSWQLPERVPSVTVPALSIQPLVENAVRHGIEGMPRGGRIEITVENEGDEVVVRVVNPIPNGGSRASAVQGHRIGLNSSRARIEALTGGRGRLRAGIEGGRYVVSVRVPLVGNG